jgi:tetratricopeptide (TPR) repeat protein
LRKCEEDPSQQSLQQGYYMKAVTNYAVTLEKLGKRHDAIAILNKLKDQFREEIRIFNNLGIIQKRQGNNREAEESYLSALQIDSQSFFPNYNMGVFKASLGGPDNDKQAVIFFNKALELARANKEEVYEINVLVNLGLVYERLSALAEAMGCLEAALQIDPSNTKIAHKLAQLRQLAAARQQQKAQ